MRRIQSKRLMRMTREERAGEKGIEERALFTKKSGTIVNSPYTIRAMYLRLKRQFIFVNSFSRGALALRETIEKMAGKVKAKVQRERRRTIHATGLSNRTGPVVIRKPLELILSNNLPSKNLRGEWEAHPTYLKAVRLAARGDGEAVKRMAAQYA